LHFSNAKDNIQGPTSEIASIQIASLQRRFPKELELPPQTARVRVYVSNSDSEEPRSNGSLEDIAPEYASITFNLGGAPYKPFLSESDSGSADEHTSSTGVRKEPTVNGVDNLVESLKNQELRDDLNLLARTKLVELGKTLQEDIDLPIVGRNHKGVLFVLLCKPAEQATVSSLLVKRLESWISPRLREEFIICTAFPHKSARGIRRDSSESNNLLLDLNDFEFAKWWLATLVNEYSISTVVAFGSQTSYVLHGLITPSFTLRKSHLSTNGNYQFSKKVGKTSAHGKIGAHEVRVFYFPHTNAQGSTKAAFQMQWAEVDKLLS